ncbi:hypothetical protein [Nonomuraea africana]|uniref:Uncharacterized protein n=1 Tax=Nonomuraea africana TaxID=46171 RepID=A0ABR9KV44_9ACTN|nr:hypothetical protein [Nonomuraea africana]
MTGVADLRTVLDEDKRPTLIVTPRTVRTEVRDDVVTMSCKRIAAIPRRAATSWRRCGRSIGRSPRASWASDLTKHY